MDPLRPDDPRQVGAYRLRGRLGAGGMGEVFLGNSPGGRDVVVKLIRSELAGQPKYRRRFVREVEAAQRVGGFHTAQVVEARPEEDPPWMVTEYIPGPSLRELVLTQGPLPVERVWALAAQLSEGLAAIHNCGLVHRDLKPANVIMAPDGPRIIDFGIARMADASVLTEDGAVVGTYAFMSPEQVQAREVGPASDVFSLGGVLVFAATGRAPFEAPSLPAIVYRIGTTEPNLGGVDAGLRGLVAACLAKRPAERPTSADLLARLSGSAPGSVSFPPPTVGHQLPVDAGSNPSDARSQSPDVVGREPTRPPGVRRRGFLFGGVGAAVAVTVPVIWVASRPDTPGNTPSNPSPTTPARTPEPIFEGPLVGHGAVVEGVSFTPNGEQVVTGGAEGSIIVWDAGTGKQVRKFPQRHTYPVLPPEFSADAKIMVTGAEVAIVWDFATGRMVRAIETQSRGGFDAPLESVALSPDGRLIATDGSAGAVLWDVATGRKVRTVGDGSRVGTVVFTPDGKTLVTGGDRLGAWDVATGAAVRTFQSSGDGPGMVSISRDGTKVATSGPSQPPQLWDFATGRKIGDFEGNGLESGPIAFSPDGKLLASTEPPNTETSSESISPYIWLWDVATRENVRTITRGHTGEIHSVAFSPGGKALATASDDRTARLWNLT